MPPSRRRPPATSPGSRKPRVAGLRPAEPTKPSTTQPSTTQPSTTPADDTPTTVIPVIAGRSSSTDYATTTPAAQESLAARRARRAKPQEADDTASADTDTDTVFEAEPVPSAEAEPMRAVDSGEGVPNWFGSIGGNIRNASQGTKVLVLGIVAVLLAAFGVYAGLQWHATATDANAQNTAYIDTATTSQVKGEVIDAIQKVLTYTYANPQQTQQDAHNVLTGSALCQYDALFKTVLAQAPSQKITVTTSIDQSNSGVEQLQGDQARLLLLINQESTRGSDGQKITSQAVLEVGAISQGGSWKVDNLSTFGTGSNPASC
ncbi:MAG TPA: hypothetical protein VHX38_08335 [Pseudonocardiaceae bacterium]|jgi:Mce-associated membrane protein|nr:hypothetical protein [Pseudonocardiaceae bacterium]